MAVLIRFKQKNEYKKRRTKVNAFVNFYEAVLLPQTTIKEEDVKNEGKKCVNKLWQWYKWSANKHGFVELLPVDYYRLDTSKQVVETHTTKFKKERKKENTMRFLKCRIHLVLLSISIENEN